MRHLDVIANVAGQTAGRVFPLLCDMEQYPKYSGVLSSLTVAGSGNGTAVSTWTVKFGQGTATWSQQDCFDPAATTIQFKRLSGDIDNFTGTWVLRDQDAGCAVQFSADFDIGMPALAAIIEPMIENMLRENITAILKGLFGEQAVIQA